MKVLFLAIALTSLCSAELDLSAFDPVDYSTSSNSINTMQAIRAARAIRSNSSVTQRREINCQNCNWCSGYGTVLCYACKGSGRNNRGTYCITCEGRGVTLCVHCNHGQICQ
jgi:hypothetical protein